MSSSSSSSFQSRSFVLLLLVLVLSLLVVRVGVGISILFGTTNSSSSNRNSSSSSNRQEDAPLLQAQQTNTHTKTRILYTITSLAEYNTGSRATVRGSDRLNETLIPVVSEGVQSMLRAGYHVDVMLVSHYTLRPERLQLLRDSLSNDGVGERLQVWDNAMPMGYDVSQYQGINDTTSLIRQRDISLARQHRFVVRDHLLDYDVFVNFEDDMLVTGDLVQHYVKVSNDIERLKALAPDDLPANEKTTTTTIHNKQFYEKNYWGTMTKGQLSRMIPGFMRVEVLLDPETNKGHTKVSPVPVDFDFGSNGKNSTTSTTNGILDPTACCALSIENSSPKRPSSPKAEQLMLWETEIQPLGVRKLPPESSLDWVALLRGPTHDGSKPANSIIGDYWAGNDGYFTGKEARRPGGDSRKFINNMGGWMATRQQIWNWHTQICPGGFLPPFEAPHYRFDGLDLRDVEWWSGGLHLVTKRHACNMQRIVSLNPQDFSKHLIYHTANNKQTQLGLGRFTKAQDLLGQLNTVRKNAEAAMLKEATKI